MHKCSIPSNAKKETELVQDMRAVMTIQTQTLVKEDLQNTSESGKNDSVSQFGARGNINGNVSFTKITFNIS